MLLLLGLQHRRFFEKPQSGLTLTGREHGNTFAFGNG
jgi:hypothetical protein